MRRSTVPSLLVVFHAITNGGVALLYNLDIISLTFVYCLILYHILQKNNYTEMLNLNFNLTLTLST
jgi:hypothetical protein